MFMRKARIHEQARQVLLVRADFQAVPKTEQMRMMDAFVNASFCISRAWPVLVAKQVILHANVQVRRVPVTTRQIDLSELTVRQPKTEQMRTVEASLRLDAVTSAGFRISRGKAADLIKHGDVRWMGGVRAQTCLTSQQCCASSA